MFRVYLMLANGTEVIYYEGDKYLAQSAVADFNSMAFEARLEEVI